MYPLPTLHVPGDLTVASRTDNEYRLTKHEEAMVRRIGMLAHVSGVVSTDMHPEKYWCGVIAEPIEMQDENRSDSTRSG